MAYTKATLKNSGEKSSPCFRPYSPTILSFTLKIKIPDNTKMVILPKRKCHNVGVSLQLVPFTEFNKGLLQYQSFKVIRRKKSLFYCGCYSWAGKF
jgi:hypothetical protein